MHPMRTIQMFVPNQPTVEVALMPDDTIDLLPNIEGVVRINKRDVPTLVRILAELSK